MNEVIVVKNKERTPLYDVAKGICIISVVLGHLGIATRFVYFYHLPILFFISGLFFNAEKHSFKDFLLKKIKSLYVPYVIISLLFAIIFDFQNMKNIKYVLRIFLFDGKAPFTGTFWFIPCLFINSTIAFITEKLTVKFDKKIRQGIYLGLFCFYVVMTFLFYKLNIHLYYNLHLVPWLQIIYILAFLFKSLYLQNIFENKKVSIITGASGFTLLLLATLFTNLRIDIVQNQFMNSFLWVVFVFIGLCFVFGVSSLIQKLNLFSLIGKHSFYIMCFHFVTFAFINVILSGFKEFDLGWEMEYPPYWFIYCMGGVFVPLVLSLLVNFLKKEVKLLCKK